MLNNLELLDYDFDFGRHKARFDLAYDGVPEDCCLVVFADVATDTDYDLQWVGGREVEVARPVAELGDMKCHIQNAYEFPLTLQTVDPNEIPDKFVRVLSDLLNTHYNEYMKEVSELAYAEAMDDEAARGDYLYDCWRDAQ